jgi:threonine dehydrogenase-like Zn-dependent dehydrogenase
MTMTEQDLRALIRETVLKALAAKDAAGTPQRPSSRHDDADRPDRLAAGHPSHGVYVALVNLGEACLIEPAVPCTHCEYCKSHGH